MRFSAFILLTILIALVVQPLPAAAAEEFAEKPEYAVLIMLDGFRRDYFSMFELPNMEALIEQGSWVAEAKSVFPSTTTPNQTSFVTGAWPETTGIPNNSRYDRGREKIIGPLRDNRAPTIAEIFREAGLTSASVSHFMLEHRGVDRYVTGRASQVVELIHSGQPNLLVYYNAETDTAGHSYGPYSAGMRRVAEKADREVGEIVRALKDAGTFEKTVLVIASDHGMGIHYSRGVDPNPRDVLTSLGFKVATRTEDITADTEIVYLQSGSSFLYLRKEQMTDERYRQLVEAFRQIKHARLLLPEDIRARHADPEAVGDLVLVPERGYSLFPGDDRSGVHGRPQEEDCMLFFAGAGVRPGNVVAHGSIVDVVPTLLYLFGLQPPETVDGKVLKGILDVPEWKLKLTRAGDYLPLDVSASSSRKGYDAAQALDGDPRTFWVSRAFESLEEFEPQHITVDFGERKTVARIEYVSRKFRKSLAPRAFQVQVSTDGEDFSTVMAGEMPPVKNGESYSIQLDQPVQARYIRLLIKSAYLPNVQAAELKFWSE